MAGCFHSTARPANKELNMERNKLDPAKAFLWWGVLPFYALIIGSMIWYVLRDI